ncbi:ribonuclease Z [bacterium]|nr:ribonuclease Z [bacterium]
MQSGVDMRENLHDERRSESQGDSLRLRVTFLGVGSWFPEADKAGPATLVESAGGALLVDCGEGAVRRLVGANVPIERVDAILVTHTHPDHVAGLLPFFFALRVTKMRTAPMTIAGPPGIAGLVALLPKFGDPDLLDEIPALDIRELAPNLAVDIAGCRVTPHAVSHRDPTFGYRIESGGAVIAFSADTGPCDALIELARDADLFICEAGTTGAYPMHLTPEQAGEAAAAANAKRVRLTHLAPAADPDEFLARARKVYTGDIDIARELDAVDLGE